MKITGVRNDGFSLIELLAVIAILTVAYGIAMPAWRSLVRDTELSAVVSTYLNAFNSARASALDARRNITLCPLDDKGNCTGRWGEALTLYFDDDRDGKLAHQQDVIEQVNMPAAKSVKVTFAAFATTKFVTLRANGTYRRNGTFRFCPEDAENGRAIIINVLGRARTESLRCNPR